MSKKNCAGGTAPDAPAARQPEALVVQAPVPEAVAPVSASYTLGFLSALLIAVALNPLNSTMLATAIASIERDFSDPVSVGAWLVAALYLASAIAQPVLGNIADLVGPRRMLLVGLLLVGMSAVLGYIASTLTLLLVSRVILAVGTAAGYPAVMAILNKTADAQGLRPSARMLAALSIAMNVSVAVGPVAGGLLVEGFGWRATFVVNLPLAVVAGLLVLVAIEPDGERSSLRVAFARLDLTGIALFGASVSALLVFLIHSTEAIQWPLFAVFSLLAMALVWVEWHKRQPFIDVRMLAGNSPLVCVYLRQGLVFLGSYLLFYSFPQWLQDFRNLSPALIGVLLLPMPVVSSIIAWKLAGRAPSTQYLVGALAMLVCGPAVLAMDGNPSSLLVVLIAVALGLATGATTQGNQQGLIEFGPPGSMGAVAGMFRTAQYGGAMLSACIGAWVFTDKASPGSMNGIGVALVPVALALLLLALLDRRSGPASRDQPSDSLG
ncbi:MAG: MFS transporter [Pseudomonas sp.]|uniref:MFS transporter n=1 Tax=Pseudomonas sp. TaxID=306 RepID=UPI0039826149